MPSGNPWPRISIVTPSHNQGQFLEETIRSVLLQGYPDVEYIIIDAGSRDASPDIIRRYEPWIAYWVSEPDRGQGDAINKGWRRATGEFITWLNSDDILLPGWARHCVLALATNPEAGFVCGDVTVIDERSRPLAVMRSIHATLETMVANWQANPLQQPGSLLRRELLARCGYLDERFYICMDFDYWVRLLTAGIEIHYAKHLLAGFRRHPESKTATPSIRSSRWQWETYQVWTKYVKEFSRVLPARAHRPVLSTCWNEAAHNLFWRGDGWLGRRWAWEYVKAGGMPVVPRALSIFAISYLGKHAGGPAQAYRWLRSILRGKP
jgi:GT2 family glycosyltransferase